MSNEDPCSVAIKSLSSRQAPKGVSSVGDVRIATQSGSRVPSPGQGELARLLICAVYDSLEPFALVANVWRRDRPPSTV